MGNDELTADQLTENVVKVCQNVSKSFPGGWPNISKLAIEVANMPLLNIYFSKGKFPISVIGLSLLESPH